MLPHCYYSIHPKLIHFFLHVALFRGQVFHFALADILTTALVNHSIILFIYFSLFLSSVIPPSNKRKHKQIFGMKIRVKYKPKLFLSLNITFKVLPSLPSFFLHIFFFFLTQTLPTVFTLSNSLFFTEPDDSGVCLYRSHETFLIRSAIAYLYLAYIPNDFWLWWLWISCPLFHQYSSAHLWMN